MTRGNRQHLYQGHHSYNELKQERIINNANMVYINIVYNFTFGKNKPNLKLKMQNKDNDSGILNRY